MKKILLTLIILLFIPSLCFSASTWAVGSCKYTNVNTVIQAATTVAGDTVTIPACEGTDGNWTTGLTINKAITLQGAGYGKTVINLASAFTVFNLTGAVRITGIGIYTTNAHSNTNAPIKITGKGWRIDHCKINFNGTVSSYGIYTYASSYANAPAGLIDSNIIENARIVTNASTGDQNIMNQMWYSGSMGAADNGDSVYIENNTLSKNIVGNVLDGNYGGRYVARFNLIIDSEIMTHGYQQLNTRGMRSWEIYNNEFRAVNSSLALWPVFLRSGEGLLFNNSITGVGWNDANLRIDHRRYAEAFDMGLCGSGFVGDGNEPGQTGWLCRDQIGAGKDTELTTRTSGVTTWKAQTKVPMYAFGNGLPIYVASGGVHIQHNRDYFDGGTWGEQSSQTSPFNGTSGVGRGSIANRPTTCTTGVGYWATDENKLYKCVASAWEVTASYEPYTCPHPLADPSAQGSCDFTTAGTTGYTLTGGESDETAPTITQASVSTAGTSVLFTFDEPITATSGAAFTLDFGTAVTLTCPAVETSASSLTCTTSRTIYQSEGNSTFDYTGTKVVDTADTPNALAAISNQAIQNLSTQVETPPAVGLTISSHTGAVVTTTPSGISCGSTCYADFETGTTVTVSGYCLPNYEGFTITSEKDCNTETGAVAMSAAKECAAYCSKIAADNKVGAAGLPGHRVGAGNPAHKRY